MSASGSAEQVSHGEHEWFLSGGGFLWPIRVAVRIGGGDGRQAAPGAPACR